MSRWIIVITGRPAVCHDIDGTCAEAVRRAVEVMREDGEECVLLTRDESSPGWRTCGTFSPPTNGAKQKSKTSGGSE